VKSTQSKFIAKTSTEQASGMRYFQPSFCHLWRATLLQIPQDHHTVTLSPQRACLWSQTASAPWECHAVKRALQVQTPASSVTGVQRQGTPPAGSGADQVLRKGTVTLLQPSPDGRSPPGDGCLRAEGKKGKHCFTLPGRLEPEDSKRVAQRNRRP